MGTASKLRLRVSLAAGLLLAVPAAASESKQVVLLGDAGPDWRHAGQIIEAHGGRIVHVPPPAVLVGRIPEGAILALRAARDGPIGSASSTAA